jgi:hypothetical protein
MDRGMAAPPIRLLDRELIRQRFHALRRLRNPLSVVFAEQVFNPAQALFYSIQSLLCLVKVFVIVHEAPRIIPANSSTVTCFAISQA